MSKKNVHKLTPAPSAEYILVGIASHENDYRISWALNEALNFHFTKTDNHSSFNKRLSELQEFAKYTFNADDYSPLFTLISNRCDNGFLLDELKNIDFIMKIENFPESFDISQFLIQLKSVQFISAVFLIDGAKLKNKDRI